MWVTHGNWQPGDNSTGDALPAAARHHGQSNTTCRALICSEVMILTDRPQKIIALADIHREASDATAAQVRTGRQRSRLSGNVGIMAMADAQLGLLEAPG